jgi:hypothetical protein
VVYSESAYCLTALRYSNLDDRSPLTGYGCYTDDNPSNTRIYYIDIGTATPGLAPSSTSAPSSSPAPPGSSPSPGSSSPTNKAASATNSQTTTQSTIPKATSSESDAIQMKSNNIAIGVGLAVPLASLIISATGVWLAYRAHKLERMRPAMEILSRSLPFGRSVARQTQIAPV